MNDHELDLALADFGAQRVEATAPPVLRQRIRTMPLPTEAGHGWLPQSPRWRLRSMFSALKFALAAAIVALFGGFLLAGILPQPEGNEVLPGAITVSPSPLATSEGLASGDIQEVAPSRQATELEGLPPSLVTEEVEPGVHRLVSDGHLDLTQAMVPDREIATTALSPDGSAWMFGPDSFFRLGAEGDLLPWPDGRPDDAAFAPSGDIWASYPGVIQVFDGTVWTTHAVGVTADRLEFTPDGRTWAQIWDEDKQAAVVGWFEPDGAAFVPAREGSAAGAWNVGLADGGAWSIRSDGTLELYRWGTGEWETMPSPPEPGYGVLQIGPEGTVWLARCPGSACWGPFASRDEATLARLEDGEWRELARPEIGLALWGIERVAPDGAVWGPASPRRDDTCSGIVRFDGVASSRWLDGHCIEAIETDHDGRAWVQAFERSTLEGSNKTDDGPVETYVITPEAVAE